MRERENGRARERERDFSETNLGTVVHLLPCCEYRISGLRRKEETEEAKENVKNAKKGDKNGGTHAIPLIRRETRSFSRSLR